MGLFGDIFDTIGDVAEFAGDVVKLTGELVGEVAETTAEFAGEAVEAAADSVKESVGEAMAGQELSVDELADVYNDTTEKEFEDIVKQDVGKQDDLDDLIGDAITYINQ